jgi:hypothetical protein
LDNRPPVGGRHFCNLMGKLPYTTLKEGIFTHPTLAEGLNALFLTFDA